MLLKVDKKIKLEEIESYYDVLYGFIDNNEIVDLLLPKELENNYLGLIPALYQFAMTWVRYDNSGKLLLDIDDPQKVDFGKLYENELLFPLISLVWNTNEVYNCDGKINLRNHLKPFNVELFDRMKKVKSLKGNKLLLTVFDHLPEERGLLPCFEINHEFIKNESILSANLRPSIADILNYSLDLKTNFELVGQHLLGIVYELMKNTYEWAKDDKNNVPLDPNLRGLIMRFFKKRRKTLLDDFKTHKGLTDYFTSSTLKENSQEEIYFLELSVFDSGIGFVEKYKSLNNSEGLNEIDIIKKCLILHNTSAKGLGKDDKGIGLDRILSILDKKGFLRIKTGQICVYRNLISHNYIAVSNNNIAEMELYDWNNCNSNDYTMNKNAQGSVITIIYPLSSKTENE